MNCKTDLDIRLFKRNAEKLFLEDYQKKLPETFFGRLPENWKITKKIARKKNKLKN